MKVNVFMTLLAVAASALIGYTFYASGCSTLQIWVCTLIVALLLVTGMGLSLAGYPRSTMLLKVSAFVMLLVSLILNVILIATEVAPTGFIITNGLFVVVTLALGYLLCQSKQ